MIMNAKRLGWEIKSFDNNCCIFSKKISDMTQNDRNTKQLLEMIIKPQRLLLGNLYVK